MITLNKMGGYNNEKRIVNIHRAVESITVKKGNK